MGPVVDEAAYQEVITQLRAYTYEVFRICENMQSIASTCISIMGDDPAATKSASALSKSIYQIESGVDSINDVIVGMTKELEYSIGCNRNVNHD